MTNNPLQKFFRQPSLYIRLPTQNRWYTTDDIELVNNSEIPVYGLSAIDDIMLNTPDAMLNGQALEKVIKNCVPAIKNVKNILIPDLETIFVAIKIATNEGKYDYDRKCPKCGHENNFDIQCQHLLDTMSFIEDQDTTVQIDDQLIVHVKPYTFEMRQLYIQKEFEEEKLLRSMSLPTQDEFVAAKLAGEMVDRLTRMTFSLVSNSITKVHLVNENQDVTEPEFINEWLTSISSTQANAVINTVASLNSIGVNKNVEIQCQSCGHTWDDKLNFDPVDFFVKRS